VIADDTADVTQCATEILAQAEHDVLAQAVLVTTSESFAERVVLEVNSQSEELSRRHIIAESLFAHGIICVVDNMQQALELADLYAPEHLCIFAEDSLELAGRIQHAGCIFAGDHPTVAIGDYIAGPSHALPTVGTARFASPLNTTDFVRLMNVVNVDAKMIQELGPQARVIAEAEGLTAHVQALISAKGRQNG